MKSPPGVKGQDGLRPSIFTSLKWQLVPFKIKIKMAATTLARWMWFVDIVVEKHFKQTTNAISQAQIREKLPHFRILSCCRGHVTQSTKNYNLPA